jgi:flavin-dependent thymidylate synthase
MPGKEIQNWVDPAMYAAEPIREVTPRVHLISATSDPLGAIAAACMIYEGKVCRGLHEVTDEMREHYWEEVQKTHLTAPLEFVDFHFLIEGVTRGFTHQLVRQRTAVYAQESTRFAVKENMADEVAMPPSLLEMLEGHDPSCEEEPGEVEIWNDALATTEKAYEELVNLGIPAEDARGLLPTNITTRIHYKTNLRNLADHAGNRLCTQAQFEWRQVFSELVKSIRFYCPPVKINPTTGLGEGLSQAWMFERIADSNLFRPVCYAKGKCPFKADFDRGCTIRPRVEEGKFDEIDPREWLSDHKAARRGV